MEKIGIEDFKKLNIVVGTIIEAETIKGSNKLLKFNIDIGTETRQIVGGLASAYQPSELLGKQVLILENLKPRTLIGLESQGMILAASNSEGLPVIIQPLSPVSNGSVIK